MNVTVLCDGYERGLDRILQASSDLDIGENAFELMRTWARNEEQRAKTLWNDRFNRTSSTIDILWGESETNFLSSVEKIAGANLLFITSGEFSKIMFDYFNNVDNSQMFGPFNAVTDELALRLGVYASSMSFAGSI